MYAIGFKTKLIVLRNHVTERDIRKGFEEKSSFGKYSPVKRIITAVMHAHIVRDVGESGKNCNASVAETVEMETFAMLFAIRIVVIISGRLFKMEINLRAAEDSRFLLPIFPIEEMTRERGTDKSPVSEPEQSAEIAIITMKRHIKRKVMIASPC